MVIVQVFQQGRSTYQKQTLYTKLAANLEAHCGLSPSDLIISCMRNEKEDWSLGMGRAQFLVGDL